jgi:hypothetical protein
MDCCLEFLITADARVAVKTDSRRVGSDEERTRTNFTSPDVRSHQQYRRESACRPVGAEVLLLDGENTFTSQFLDWAVNCQAR